MRDDLLCEQNFEMLDGDSFALNLALSRGRRLARLGVIIRACQQRLKELKRYTLQTGLVSQETAKLVKCMERSVRLCRHTMRQIEKSIGRIKQSAELVESLDDLQTIRQIQKTADIVTRYKHLDTFEKQAQTLLKTYAHCLRPPGRPDRRPVRKAVADAPRISSFLPNSSHRS
jgi:hypothetical protein